jgi:hypothetical protein
MAYAGSKGKHAIKEIVPGLAECKNNFTCGHGTCNQFGRCHCYHAYTGPRCLVSTRESFDCLSKLKYLTYRLLPCPKARIGNNVKLYFLLLVYL